VKVHPSGANIYVCEPGGYDMRTRTMAYVLVGEVCNLEDYIRTDDGKKLTFGHCVGIGRPSEPCGFDGGIRIRSCIDPKAAIYRSPFLRVNQALDSIPSAS
jgi:hypothetical protein